MLPPETRESFESMVGWQESRPWFSMFFLNILPLLAILAIAALLFIGLYKLFGIWYFVFCVLATVWFMRIAERTPVSKPRSLL